MKKIILLILCVFLVCDNSFGQEFILNPIDLIGDSDVKEILQHPDGSICFITEKNIYTYDGHILEQLASINDNEDGLTSMEMYNNQLYFGTKKGNLLMMIDDSLVVAAQIVEDRISDVVRYNDQFLLIATYNSGVFKYDYYSNELVYLKSFNHHQINEIAVVNNEIFFGTDRGLYFHSNLTDAGNKVIEIGNRIITNITVQENRYLWLSEFQSTVIRMDITTRQHLELEFGKNNRINDLTCSSNRLFVSSKKGLFHYQMPGIDESRIPNSNDIFHDNNVITRTTYIDDELNLWVGSQNQLSKASLLFSRWQLDVPFDIQALSYADSNIYVGTNMGVYCVKHPPGNTNLVLKDVNVTCIDNLGKFIAIGSYSSGLTLISMDGSKLDKSSYPNFQNQTILDLQFISNNKLIVSTLSGVYFLTLKNKNWSMDGKIPELDNFYILGIHVINEDEIWFGTDKKGCIRFKNNQATHFATDNKGDKLKSIYSIASSPAGELWIVSKENGLLQFSNEGFEKVPSQNDDWATVTSLVYLDSDQLLMVGLNEVSFYDIKSGAQLMFDDELKIESGESFLNSFCYVRDKVIFEHNGSLYSTSKARFDIRSIPITSLKKLEVNLTTIDTARHSFAESENNFTFTFNGVLHRNPEKVIYGYMLEGFDEKWRYTQDRSVSYPHLEPGEYSFKVRSNQSKDFEKAHEVMYTFEIEKVFYKTWPFLLLLCGLIAITLNMRLRRKRKEKDIINELKLQKTETQLSNLKTQLNPHFLFNSFNTMIGLIEEDKERSIEFIEQLTDFYRMVLEIGDSELISIDKELDLLKSYKQLLKERFPIGLNIDIQSDWKSSLIPPLSLQLLVENAVKHNILSTSSPLSININQVNHHIVVKNNYNPKPIAPKSTGIGLSNLKKRYELIAGKKIEMIIDEEFVTVSLPIIQSTDNKLS